MDFDYPFRFAPLGMIAAREGLKTSSSASGGHILSKAKAIARDALLVITVLRLIKLQ